MKIRQDFITNSSSSSYIIAWHPTKNPTEKEAFINALISRILDSNDGETCSAYIYRTRDDLAAFARNHYYDSIEEFLECEGENFANQFRTMLECVDNGFTIYDKWIDNRDYMTPYFLKILLEESPNAVIIKYGD